MQNIQVYIEYSGLYSYSYRNLDDLILKFNHFPGICEGA